MHKLFSGNTKLSAAAIVSAAAGGCSSAEKENAAAVGVSPTGSDKIKVALVGCGGRGNAALTNLIDADQNIEIVALGDVFPEQLELCRKTVREFVEKKYPNKFKDIWKVSPETSFVGLDAVDKVLTTDADVVALATPPIFRPYYIEKCLKAKKHVFAEKPIAVDAAGLRKIYNELIPLADKEKLNVVCGTQMRYQPALIEAIDRIRGGQIGDVVAGVFYRHVGRYLMGQTATKANRPLQPDDVEYQLRNWLGFRWTSGDLFVELFVHNLDIALWAFGDQPVEVAGSGSRSWNIPAPQFGDRYSSIAAQFQFASGATLSTSCIQEPNATPYMPLKVIGTKGVAELSFESQKIKGEKPWSAPSPAKQAIVAEHETMFSAVRNGGHVNAMKTCADSCFAAIAGRESAYSGKRLKCKWITEKSQQDWLPKNLSLDGKLPVQPVPNPVDYKLI